MGENVSTEPLGSSSAGISDADGRKEGVRGGRIAKRCRAAPRSVLLGTKNRQTEQWTLGFVAPC